MEKKTIVIAEAGVNHNGDLGRARELVNAAAAAGADLVKFQTFSAERLATVSAPKAAYQLSRTPLGDSQFEMLKKLELTEAAHEELLEYCSSVGIGFFSTAFDTQSLDYLVRLGIDRIKVPSGEITNLPYLRHVGQFGLPVILSSGMSNLAEVQSALEALEASGIKKNDITVLHCNTAYPTPMHDVNLRAMERIRAEFKVSVGYSDHTLGIEVPIAAVALGANVIEKHITLSRNDPGPDQAASLEPAEFASMVVAIRHIEVALGDDLKQPTESELANRAVVRKSLVASRSIKTGTPFSFDNICVKRPGTGISPMRVDEVIGKAAKRDFEKDELIEL